MEKTQSVRPEAIQQLKKLVGEYLDMAYYNGTDVELHKEMPRLLKVTEKIEKILSKIHSEDLEVPDIYFTIYRELVSISSTLGSSGKFTELLESQNISEYQNKITNKLLSYPKEYEVYIPLRMVSLSPDNPLIITNTVRVTKVPSALVSALPPAISLQGKVHLYDDIVYLIFRIKSFLGIFTGHSQERVKSEYKKILASLIVANFLIEGSELGFVQANMSWPIKTYLYCLDDKSETFSFDLPVPESKLLQQLYFSKNNRDSLPSRIIDTNISTLFQCDSKSEPEAGDQIARVRTSLEWYFEGLANENETFSFILFCTAVEALLGSSNEKTSITHRLSDRISFLIARDAIERENIRKEFVKTYDLRSDIIHRGKSRLRIKERKSLYFLRQSLEKAIRKEMTMLPTR